MEIASICMLLTATLSIQPDTSQFFRYDNIYLKCDTPPNSTGWTLRKSHAYHTPEPCDDSCVLCDVYPSDSGMYWCESEHGNCTSNTINVTVVAGVVLLESPTHPVSEGDEVTLSCKYKGRYSNTPTTQFAATFYKNNIPIAGGHNGTLIIRSVSICDQGYYKCKHPTKGESPESWLDVIASPRTAAGAQCELEVAAKDHVTLPCQMYTSDYPTYIVWRKAESGYVYIYYDGQERTVYPYLDCVERKHPGTRTGDASIIMRNVSTYDAGTYTCGVVVAVGAREQYDVKLTVIEDDPIYPVGTQPTIVSMGTVTTVSNVYVLGLGLLIASHWHVYV
ncbi:tyrosine-protein kinase-like otk [Epinephelus moara]|uniref:tyrosine-protein kinase-like otk n=1 Tax=Epinephelus moara TaxID=300413 RepID=UPI00214E5637|nr:tyrosine-protein kinase-like otk [Epinephelus moara]